MSRLTILDRINAYMERRRQRRAYQQTVLAVSELPEHIRKDIGWPARYEASQGDLR